ncbi:MAG: hypothetical protein Q9219_003677 [cf. Caloplaca sp. 3 TL-2023]
MALSDVRVQQVLTGLSSLIGVVALGGGIQSIATPKTFAEKNMGLPIDSSAIPFVSVAGARNLSSGLTILTLLYMGQRKAVGTVLMCGVVAGMTDAWISAKYNARQGLAVGHAITGGTGFVGYAILVHALRAGYRVRLAVRRESDIKKIKAAPSCQPYLDKIEFALVEDITLEGAFDEALRDVSFIIHAASPIPAPNCIKPYEDTMIKPALEGTLSILHSAANFPSVKRAVITSSVVVVMTNDESRVHNESTLVETPSGPFPDQYAAYLAGKAHTLRAVHEFLKPENPHFTVINLIPSFVAGKNELAVTPEAISSPNSSNYMPLASILGSGAPMPLPGVTVHIDDVAMVHVAALDPNVEGNQDFVLTAGGIDGIQWDDAKEIARRRFPAAVGKGLLPLKGSTETKGIKLDGSKAEKVFGFKYKTFEEQIVSSVTHYLDAIEKRHQIVAEALEEGRLTREKGH